MTNLFRRLFSARRSVEQGSHEELLVKNGEYAALYQMQFKSKKEIVA